MRYLSIKVSIDRPLLPGFMAEVAYLGYHGIYSDR